jgi:SAM-dependent methyltransferase
VLGLLENEAVGDARSAREQRIRDAKAGEAAEADDPGATPDDAMEIASTLARLGRLEGKAVLELGCGSGRFTRRLAARSRAVLAVDFSRESLRQAARTLVTAGAQVGLVQADVSRLALAPARFDAALSTLYSNLPSRALRAASSAVVAGALKPGGRYVLTAHHQDIRRRLRGKPKEETYANGIYFRSFTRGALQRELEPHFKRLELGTICIRLPYLSRMARFRPGLSRACERIPALNRLGELLIVTAENG